MSSRLLQRTNAGVADPVRVLFELHPELDVALDDQLLRMGTVRYVLSDVSDPDVPRVLCRYRSIRDLALDRTGAVAMHNLDLTERQLELLQTAATHRLADPDGPHHEPGTFMAGRDEIAELVDLGLLQASEQHIERRIWILTFAGKKALPKRPGGGWTIHFPLPGERRP